MSKDLAVLLQGFDYSPNEVSVRRILGIDGREKIQMRLDLGVFQMEMSGRPDGKRPYGFESLVHYFLAQKEENSASPLGESNWGLDADACGELKQEAMQYYYRYLSLFHLGEYGMVIRDTDRNMAAFDLIHEYAEDESERVSVESFRPYVIMMGFRAQACLALEDKDYDRALELIAEGIGRIIEFLSAAGREDVIAQSREIQFLEEWQDRIRSNRPLSAAERLRRELSMAVEKEDYESAARIRDRIREIA